MRAVLCFLLLSATICSLAGQPCRIVLIDKEDGWPVPGVELRTVHGVRLVSDNAGLIACDLPEVMGRETWFEVRGHGYRVKADGFGYRGVHFTPQPGKTLSVELQREVIARRVGRLTGAGLFAESQKLGEEVDWKESGVFGCDSVVTAELDGCLHWFWGDTNLAHHPLGIFNVSGATTDKFMPPAKPPLRPPYAFFTARTNSTAAGGEHPRGMAQVPGEGPTWIWGAITLPDANATPHLVAAAVKVKGELHAYRWDLVEWDPCEKLFLPLKTVWKKDASRSEPPPVPNGHAVPWTDAAGQHWILFCNPFPTLRTPATYEGWKNPKTWQPIRPSRTAATPAGEAIPVHAGHMSWHPWSGKWIAIFTQKGGSPSFLGEIWLTEAAGPEGPWVNARKVLSHDDYTFYNPVLHPEFFSADSPLIYFEGTYTTMFSGNKQPTPRWEYNQVLYQVDLSKTPFKE